jgi:putative endopeptidase
MSKNPVPPEYPSWNTFTALHDANLSKLKSMLEELPKPSEGPSAANTVKEKVSAFWHSALDEEAVEAAGITPLEPLLALCDGAAKDRTATVALLQAEYAATASRTPPLHTAPPYLLSTPPPSSRPQVRRQRLLRDR